MGQRVYWQVCGLYLAAIADEQVQAKVPPLPIPVKSTLCPRSPEETPVVLLKATVMVQPVAAAPAVSAVATYLPA